MPVQSRGGNDAIGVLVEVNEGGHPLPRSDGSFLFAEWEQQVFGEAPVQKRADSRVYAEHFQVSKLAHHHIWSLSGGNQTVFRIEVNEHVELDPGSDVFWDVLAWEQNLPQLFAVQVKARS